MELISQISLLIQGDQSKTVQQGLRLRLWNKKPRTCVPLVEVVLSFIFIMVKSKLYYIFWNDLKFSLKTASFYEFELRSFNWTLKNRFVSKIRHFDFSLSKLIDMNSWLYLWFIVFRFHQKEFIVLRWIYWVVLYKQLMGKIKDNFSKMQAYRFTYIIVIFQN